MVAIGVDVTERLEAEERMRLALHDKELLLKEIYHRVKNNLQVVISLLTLQSRSIHDARAQALLRDSANRINDSGAFPYLRSHPLTVERIGEG